MANAVAVPEMDLHMTKGCGVTQRYSLNQRFEPQSLRLWKKWSKPGAVMLDVGAYTGVYSLVAAKAGAAAVAMEPLKTNANRLELNFALNKLQCTLIHAAASNVNGTAKLFYNPRYSLTSGGSLTKEVHSHFVFVPTITLDSIQLSSLRAIKIDVERHERQVLEGSMGLIRKFYPSLIIGILDSDELPSILSMLPEYRSIGRLDQHNYGLEPEHGYRS